MKIRPVKTLRQIVINRSYPLSSVINPLSNHDLNQVLQYHKVSYINHHKQYKVLLLQQITRYDKRIMNFLLHCS